MVGPVVIPMRMKRLIDVWFKTLHMWRLSITSIVCIQLPLHGFEVQRNQNSSGGPSDHINVNHYISNHLFQNSTTAEIIRHTSLVFPERLQKIVYSSHIQVHFCSYTQLLLSSCFKTPVQDPSNNSKASDGRI